MPDRAASSPVQLVADLHVELSSDRLNSPKAAAHLHGSADGLVLDVDEPAVLLRQVPSRGRRGQLPLQVVRQLIPDTPVQLRSRGHDLARLTFTPGGKLRVRPTPAGVRTAARIAVSEPRRRLVAVAVAIVAAVLLARGPLGRRHRVVST